MIGYGVGLGKAKLFNPTPITRAIALMKRLSSSPAGIFVAGQGYLQQLANLAIWSKDFTNAAWYKGVYTLTTGISGLDGSNEWNRIARGSSVTPQFADLCTASGYTVGAGNNVGKTYTTAVWLYCDSGTVGGQLLVSDLDFNTYSRAITITTTPTLFVFASSGGAGWNASGSRIGCGIVTPNNSTVYIKSMGLFPGTYTAQQIAALGIPWTMGTASVALSLGPELAPAPSGFASFQSSIATTSNSLTVTNTSAAEGYGNFGAFNSGTAYWASGTVFRGDGAAITIGGARNSFTADGAFGLALTASASTNGSVSTNRTTIGAYATFTNLSVRQILSVACPVYTNASVYMGGANGLAVSGLSTGNYTLSDGSTGYAAVDGPDGLVLDACGSVGANVVTNGTFDSNVTGWALINSATIAWDASQRMLVNVTGAAGGFQKSQTWALSTGVLHKLTFDLADGTYSGGFDLYVGGSLVTSGITAGVGKTIYFVAPSADPAFYMSRTTAATGTAYFDNIAVAPVSGIHATQSTAGNRPVLRRGLYNRATYSNDLTNVGYGVTNVAKAAGTVARTSTAASAFLSGPAFPTPFPVGDKITAYARVKAKSLGGYFGLRPSGTYPDRLDALFNLNTGVVVGAANGGGFTGATASIAGPDAQGFYIVAVNGTVGTTTCNNTICGPADSTATISGWEGAQSTLSDVYIDALGTSNGLLTASQILAEGGIPLTTSAAASNTVGRYSLAFNGISNSLALGSVPFQQADDHLVVFGIRNDSATGIAAVFSVTGAGSQRVAQIFRNGTNFTVNWQDDAATAVSFSSTIAAGETCIVTAWKSGGTRIMRKNCVQVGIDAVTSLGATTLTGANIGVSGGFYWNGAIAQSFIGKGTFSAADVLTIERWVASQTPAAPTF